MCYTVHAMLKSEQIPYGVKDFKRIRLERFSYIDKTAFIRKMEERANFLFFVRPRRFGKSMLCETLRCYYDVAEKHEEALAQLKAYAADPNLPALAAGTPVHFLCYEFKGRELVRR